jgi:transcriptional regulator with XRE-family HTH domain
MNDKSYQNYSDIALVKLIGGFVKHHRLQQNKAQAVVAKEAGISRSTLSLLERGETVTVATLLQVLRVLELLYVLDIFAVEEQISPLVYAKLQKEQRQRASSISVSEPNTPENSSLNEGDLQW